MPKILKIEESKIVTKNGLQLQRVIFSDDKIVYVKIDSGDVYPKDVPDKYVDLINTYNASHDEIDSTKPKSESSSFWNNDKNYIKDGSSDRQSQIEKTKDKKRLSKNRDTQNAINRIRDFGIILRVAGVLQVVIVVAVLIWMVFGAGAPFEVIMPSIIICGIDIALGVTYDVLGIGISGLKYRPSSIRATAITVLVLAILALFTGVISIMNILVIIYSIIALVKIGRYEEWFYGEIE